MPKQLIREGVNVSALMLVLVIVAIPPLYIKWFDSSLLAKKKPAYEIATVQVITTLDPQMKGLELVLETPTPGAQEMKNELKVVEDIELSQRIQEIVPETRQEGQGEIFEVRRSSDTTKVSFDVVDNVVMGLGGYYVRGYDNVPIDLARYPGGVAWDDSYVKGEMIKAKISYYWPPYSGQNCHGDCIYTADGSYWADYIGRALACPVEYPLGSTWYIFGRAWICRDRGGAIVSYDGGIWLDLLSPVMPYGIEFGTEIEVKYAGMQ